VGRELGRDRGAKVARPHSTRERRPSRMREVIQSESNMRANSPNPAFIDDEKYEVRTRYSRVYGLPIRKPGKDA
jgi:hypothetical protein